MTCVIPRSLRWPIVSAALIALVSPVLRAAEPASHAFQFRDVAEDAGLFPHIEGIQGHAAGWGDVDGDGWLDLYVGTFHRGTAKSNRLMRNQRGKFELDEQTALQISTRATGALFADLDNDGDLDLYVSSMPNTKIGNVGCTLFRNEGDGKFTNISEGNGACPDAFGGRSAAVLDFNGDGLLDILAGEDPFPGYNGSKTKSSRLFKNMGDLKFQDVTQEVGIPSGIPGLGVAAADVNNDLKPDLFLCSSAGGNVLFLNEGGTFREAPGSRETFEWKDSGGDNMVCGVCFGDVNGDGLFDVVLGPHYSSPWKTSVGPRFYLNRGLVDGAPRYEDVTDKVGLKPLPMKAPHVELQDFDNDGRVDLSTSMLKFADGKPYPVIFHNDGIADGLPKFSEDVLAINDFPNADDLAVKRTGDFFNRMIERKKVLYMAPGPSADFDNDGRLDFFLCNWWQESRSLLLKNETSGGHWLQVKLRAPEGVNRMGVGSRINVYNAGGLGDPKELIGTREMAVGFGYASCQPAIAHFGLGKSGKVDIEVLFPFGKGKREQKGIDADQRITLE